MDFSGSSREFNKALHDFTFDVAGGAAIRHLADLGYTVREIKDKLDYPLSEAQIGQAVWKYYLDTGVILTKDPAEGISEERVTYVQCQGEYGRTYFKQVVEKRKGSQDKKYIKCEFGKMLYKDKEGFLRKLEILDKKEKDYVIGLPWPLQAVWHIADERFMSIYRKLE